MHKLESDFGETDNFPLYESKNLVNWKTTNEKVKLVLGKEKEDTKNEKPENIIKNTNRAWSALDRKDEKQANNIIKRVIDKLEKDGLLQYSKEAEGDIRGFSGESAWSCFVDDGK